MSPSCSKSLMASQHMSNKTPSFHPYTFLCDFLISYHSTLVSLRFLHTAQYIPTSRSLHYTGEWFSSQIVMAHIIILMKVLLKCHLLWSPYLAFLPFPYCLHSTCHYLISSCLYTQCKLTEDFVLSTPLSLASATVPDTGWRFSKYL